MAVPKRKISKARRDKRRTAKERVKVTGFVECPQCHEVKLPHRVCRECGYYDGREVLNVE
ncbi:large subunit ribosomal protein L32 [Dethiosulfatibacter aminovorans DSM 17477]|uniref:Large ribosomal subunit protein bL32 n=1 Tax=Dethiosulfatibacter aminovorans DSM 17477 TaxID=1121476 RepID=A0A1M6DH94_9FIRM|nr:50S ribosomal protein L32 [Dethiosulfatibacter aminovorans]SHI72473.1 large subunit ribosomal protein L32 [Dethiosulfatibacter aminovorans DSM 17477]